LPQEQNEASRTAQQLLRTHTNTMSRRKFFRLSGRGLAAAALPPILPGTVTPDIPSVATDTPAEISLGAYSGAPWNVAKIDEFNSMVGTPTKIIMWYVPWENAGYKEFSVAHMDAVASRGATPLVTWEPYDWSGRGTEQPKYSLRMIFTEKHNAYIRRWARGAAKWGKTLYLRFAHEMNGDWYPWSPGVNGNSATEYTRAWKHVHKIFRKEGAKNVRWIWSANYRPLTRLSKLDPGDEYVAWIGIDGTIWVVLRIGAGGNRCLRCSGHPTGR
jgi:beta-mannanase